MNEPRYEVFSVIDRITTTRKFKWRARAANGEIVATCGRQNYASAQKAEQTIALLQSPTFANAKVVRIAHGATKLANRGPRVPRRT